MADIYVTTSWDDGHKLDTSLALLLKKYGIRGTFYLSPQDREFEKDNLLSDDEIRTISRDFEIGAHTMNHPHLPAISLLDADREIEESKRYLENVIGKKITAFSYPYGEFTPGIAGLVRTNGFRIARTTEKYHWGLQPKDRYLLPTTLETHRISLTSLPGELYALYQLAGSNIIETGRFLDWEYLALSLFDRCLKNGGIYHLWGHSWVIDKWKEWEKVERVLKYISNNNNVTYVTNSELSSIEL